MPRRDNELLRCINEGDRLPRWKAALIILLLLAAFYIEGTTYV